jgi:rare lipoprotein A (peptidoglycan hydrolase)
MSYQTVHHYDASPNKENPRLISDSKCLASKVIITSSVAMTFRKWLSGVLQVILIGTLVISGCNSEHKGGKDEQTQQEQEQEKNKDKESTINKPLHKEVGEASWYGPGFQGQETANGETYNKNEMTAAHPSLPMGTKAKVTNLENGKKVNVRINDRGPYVGNRAIDLSSAAANKLDMKKDGTADVKIETKSVKKKRSTHQSSKKKLEGKRAPRH